MEDMQKQISAIMGDPEMMQKLSAMAQSLGLGSPPEPAPTPQPSPLPEIDPALLQRISGLVGNSAIDSNQRSLLSALTPYLSRERIQKLEKAMRAAKMATMASVFLTGSSLFNPGR